MMNLTDVDWDALTLAIETTRRESPARRRQIDDFMSSRSWFDVATFCAACAQERALRLPPWQPPPCDIGNIAAALDEFGPAARISRGCLAAAADAGCRCQPLAS